MTILTVLQFPSQFIDVHIWSEHLPQPVGCAFCRLRVDEGQENHVKKSLIYFSPSGQILLCENINSSCHKSFSERCTDDTGRQPGKKTKNRIQKANFYCFWKLDLSHTRLLFSEQLEVSWGSDDVDATALLSPWLSQFSILVSALCGFQFLFVAFNRSWVAIES